MRPPVAVPVLLIPPSCPCCCTIHDTRHIYDILNLNEWCYVILILLRAPPPAGCGVCHTPELWCGAAGLCARVRACAGAAESLHTYIHSPRSGNRAQRLCKKKGIVAVFIAQYIVSTRPLLECNIYHTILMMAVSCKGHGATGAINRSRQRAR